MRYRKRTTPLCVTLLGNFLLLFAAWIEAALAAGTSHYV